MLMLTHGQHSVRVCHISRRIRLMHAVGEEHGRHRRIGPPLAKHVPTYGHVADHRLGHPSPKHALDPHDVPLPATPGERVALRRRNHGQPCSSRSRFGVSATPSNIRNARMRPRFTTSKKRRRFPRWVYRLQQEAICPPLHFASCGTGCLVEISNVMIARVHGSTAKVTVPRSTSVSARGTKRFATEQGSRAVRSRRVTAMAVVLSLAACLTQHW